MRGASLRGVGLVSLSPALYACGGRFRRRLEVNYFPSWVGNTVFHSHSQSQKLGIKFFIPNPKFLKI